MFAALFPDECRVCEKPLAEISRIPVCAKCLREPKPASADHFCTLCRTPFLNPAPLDAEGRCGLCRRGLTGFDASYSFGAYEGTLRRLIHLFKYDKILTLRRPLGAMLGAAIPRELRFDMVTPMPLHWRRRWSRGFNQADLLAREVARRSGLKVVRAVQRKRATVSQAGLTNARRRANVSGAFAVRNRSAVAGRSILLVDDVMTTGATASACAAALKRAGARRVSVLTLARVDRRLLGTAVPERSVAARAV